MTRSSRRVAAARPGWLPRWQIGHTGCMLVATPLGILVFADRAPISPAVLAVVLAVGGAGFGVPHGALDHLLGKSLLASRWGHLWPVVFFPGYLALSMVVLVSWQLVPVLTLLVFLAATVVHWGLGDVERELAAPRLHGVEIGARGALSLVVMAFRFPGEFAHGIVGTLPGVVPEPVVYGWVCTASSCLMWILVPALALVSLHHLVAAARHRSLRQLLAFGEIIALSLLFALVPPILSFTIYFCFWHSVRHVLRLSSTLDPFDVRRGALGFARHALPLTGVTLAAMAVAWVWLAVPEAALPTTTRVVFQALGALTFPHMIVTALSQTTLE